MCGARSSCEPLARRGPLPRSPRGRRWALTTGLSSCCCFPARVSSPEGSGPAGRSHGTSIPFGIKTHSPRRLAPAAGDSGVGPRPSASRGRGNGQTRCVGRLDAQPGVLATATLAHAVSSLWPERGEAEVGDPSSDRLSVRERRRLREQRRGTGINFWTKDVSAWPAPGYDTAPSKATLCAALGEVPTAP